MRYALCGLILFLFAAPLQAATVTFSDGSLTTTIAEARYGVSGEGLSFSSHDINTGAVVCCPRTAGEAFTASFNLYSYAYNAVYNGEPTAYAFPGIPASYVTAHISVDGALPLDYVEPTTFDWLATGRLQGTLLFVGENGTRERFDFDQLGVAALHFFPSCGLPCVSTGGFTIDFSQHPVPEPASGLLLSTGIAGLLAWRYRSRSRATRVAPLFLVVTGFSALVVAHLGTKYSERRPG